jgi:hypothetical protein
MARNRASFALLVATAVLLGAALSPLEGWSARGRRPRPTVGAAFVPAGFSPVVIFAINSVHLQQDSQVHSGAVVVNTGDPGATLGCSNRKLCVGIGASTPAGYAAKADSIQVKSQGAILGSAFCNSLVNNGSQPNLTCSPLALPVFPNLPSFTAESPRDSAADVTVPAGGSATLPPGDYGTIVALQDAVVTMTGGIYNVRELDFRQDTTLRFEAHSEVRIEGKLSIDEDSFVGPAPGAGVTAADIVFFVAGVNGSNGNLGATPKAAKIGIGATAQASFYVPFGTLHIRQNATATGAFLARDVDVGPGVDVHLESYFANRAPIAHPQDVVTQGAAAITITLTGEDPDGDDLVFSIASGPTQGSLGAVTQGPPPSPGDPPGCTPDECTTPPVPNRTSATVVYTPFGSGDVEDSLVFAVQDPGGKIGMAPVRINPAGDPTTPDPPLTTVAARDAVAETTRDHAVTVRLEADAPGETSLTFAIVAGSGPDHGSLSGVVQGGETPQRSATVTYTPDEGFLGGDGFEFSACGTIDGVPTCDSATAAITVASGDAVAHPQEVETPADHELTIALTGTPGAGGSQLRAGAATGALRINGKAAFLDGAEVAGNVADANGDGFGDNHNDLPGATPVLMSAAVDASGGAGSNGTVRMQIEWNVSGIRGLADSLTSAGVTLHTNKGTVDALDTHFFVGSANQDALLTDGDFQAPATQLAGVTMPVPAGPNGTLGSFSFDVLDALRKALRNETTDVFSIQGRVDEGLAGQGFQRGLQVYTTADGNLPDHLEPQLELATPGVTAPPLVFSILTLPTKGTLKDSAGEPITAVPHTLNDSVVFFAPHATSSGTDEFFFQVDDGFTTASARVGITIASAGCVGGVDANGRPCI